MRLMDDVTICDIRAGEIRIWQITSQNFRVRKIWKTWFLDMCAFSWQNATYTIQFILTIYIYKIVKNSRCQEDAPLLNFSIESAENWEKQQKVAIPLLFDHSEQACSVLYPETKYHTWNYKVWRYLKRPKICFTNNLNFLRIDRADYGASWTLSFKPKSVCLHVI